LKGGGSGKKERKLTNLINKPFKDYVEDEYDEWFSRTDLPLTAGDNFKKAPASEKAKWVSTAWSKISSDIV